MMAMSGFTGATNAWKAWMLLGPGPSTPIIVSVLLSLAILGIWLHSTKNPDAKKARLARNVCIAGFGGLTAGLLLPAFTSRAVAADIGVNGLAPLFAVAVLAYAILRFQLFDIDVKIRWAVKQGPTAALFVAVFFVVSELASEVFQSAVGTIVGILVAGVLVFLVAQPLSRLGQRVTEKTIPNARPVASMGSEERERVYAELLESAWRDGISYPGPIGSRRRPRRSPARPTSNTNPDGFRRRIWRPR